MPEFAVILIEDSPAEVALASAALALHSPRTRVLRALDLGGAIEILHREPAVLAILGRRALMRSPKKLIRALPAPAIGVAAGLPETARRKVLAAGVRAVYERPMQWKQYSELMGGLLKQWLATRTA